jgi:hypothetical protein
MPEDKKQVGRGYLSCSTYAATINKDSKDTHETHFTKTAPLTFITETIIPALA